MDRKTILMGASAFAAMTATLVAAPASARPPARSAETAGLPAAASEPGRTVSLDEVVVTARKIEENLQNVPVSVTALSGNQLQERGVVSFRDVAAFVPGFTTRESPSNPTAFVLAIRGQVQTDVLATLEPSVGVYLDGVYVARAYGLNTNLLDVQSVQVLKGPQGTLFGRNTTGGAVLLQTANPVLGDRMGVVKASYGRFNERLGSAVVNMPLGDIAAVRGAFQIMKRDGWVKNPVTGATYNARDERQGRLKVLVKPTDKVSVLLSGDWFDGEISGAVRINRFAGPTWAAVPGITAEQAAYLSDVDTARPSVPVQTNVQTQTYTATVSVETALGALKWINGYRKVSTDNQVDLDGAFFNRHITQGAVAIKQASTELQLTGSAMEGALAYVVGATYFEEKGYDSSRSQSNGGAAWTGFRGDIDNKSYGVYGQASYHISDALTATAGLRYSDDKKGIVTTSGVYLNNVRLLVCLPTTLPVATNGCRRGRDDSFDAISYTLGVDYKLSEDTLVYVKTSRGYRSGAEQLRSLTLTDTAPAQPETVKEHEIGFKGEFMEHRVRLNAAAYYNEINNAQRTTLQAIGGVAQTLLENANVRNYGLEAELSVRATPELTLSAAGSLNDPKYLSYIGYINGVAGVDKSSSRFDAIAREQFNLVADYNRDLGPARLAANLSYSYVGKMATNPESLVTLTASGYSAANAALIVAATEKRAAGVMNARAALRFGRNDAYEVGVWGRNIFDTRYYPQSLFVGGSNDYVSSVRNEPATYGIEVSARF